jgi:hypothetical protein
MPSLLVGSMAGYITFVRVSQVCILLASVNAHDGYPQILYMIYVVLWWKMWVPSISLLRYVLAKKNYHESPKHASFLSIDSARGSVDQSLHQHFCNDLVAGSDNSRT